MRVLSFDVGIKNLACCILEWNETDNKKSNLKIHYWDIINLVESQKQTDQNLLPNKCYYDKCNGKVKSFIEFNDVKYCFCSKHLSQKDALLQPIIEPYKEEKWIQVKDVKCMKCQDDTQTVSKQKTSRKTYYQNQDLNMILCSKHYKSLIDKVNNILNKIYPIKNKKVKDLTTNDLKYQLVRCLDQKKEIILKNIDMVLIENQPTFKNPTMKAISDTLYTWFMIRGIADKEINNASIGEIKFISPSNKLKEFDKKTIDEADETKKYKMTKKLSVENTKTILASYGLNNWVNHILSYDKKDDLADSFLQGWYVLNNKYEDKLYGEWQDLYKDIVIEVKDNIEVKIKKTKKVKIANIEILDIKKQNTLDLRNDLTK